MAYFRDEDYHEASDTLERLDFPEMAAVVATLEGAVRRLANGPLPTREAMRDRNPPPPRPRWR